MDKEFINHVNAHWKDVVLCKECEWGEHMKACGKVTWLCDNPLYSATGIGTDPDGYCWKGEKK